MTLSLEAFQCFNTLLGLKKQGELERHYNNIFINDYHGKIFQLEERDPFHLHVCNLKKTAKLMLF